MNNVLRGVLIGIAGSAIVLILALLVSNAGAAKPDPTLTIVPTATVGQIVTVTGDGFPKNAAAFLITAQVSPIFSGAFPSLLTKTDKTGSFEILTSFSVPGTYELHVCAHLKKHGGSWDCRSNTPVFIDIN